MKLRVLFLSTILLSFSIIQIHGLGQDVKWKGTIEEEDGIKVIKNPVEPLYGEITFKLEEDLSIGNEKDENYLFYRTWHLAVNRQGNIYVLDGIILGEIDKITFDENNIRETRKIFTSLRLINNMDGSETAIASYPDQISKIIEGRVAKFSHGYEHKFYMCAIGPQIFIYGFSSDYSLNIIDSTGKLLLKIQKESPILSILKKEKDTVREEYRDSPIKNINNIPFPKHKPHFGKILADGDWIFVEHYKSPQEQSEVWSLDVFNTQGFYLYKLSFPLRPYLIKNGYAYLIKVLEESGDVLVKRYKIKNWEQIKN